MCRNDCCEELVNAFGTDVVPTILHPDWLVLLINQNQRVHHFKLLLVQGKYPLILE